MNTDKKFDWVGLFRALLFTFMLTVGRPIYASTLHDVASAMLPGTWAQVPNSGSSITDIVACDNYAHQFDAPPATECHESGDILGYSTSGAWDRNTHKLHFVGQDHGSSSLHYVIYDAATNTWANAGGSCGINGCNELTAGGHGYAHTTVNPMTGVVYFKEYAQATQGNPYIMRVHKWAPGDTVWTVALDYYPLYDSQSATVWWDGLVPDDDGVTKHHGMFAIYGCLSGNNPPGAYMDGGTIILWDPITNTIVKNVVGFGGYSSYQCELAYSQHYNTIVFGGGNANYYKIWKWNGVTALPTAVSDAPFKVGTQQYNMQADPVTGDIFYLGSGGDNITPLPSELWRYSIRDDSYTLLSAANGYPDSVPPVGLKPPDASQLAGLISFPIEEEGVIGYVGCKNKACYFYIYKASSGETTAQRCAHAEVFRCFTFDTTADFSTGIGDANGIMGHGPYGIIPPSGTTDFTKAVRDTTVAAAGSTSSLKFITPENAGSDGSGSWVADFSDAYTRNYGANSDFYVQWRQRFSPEFLTNRWAGGGGPKQLSHALGNTPTTTNNSSCTAIDIPVQNTAPDNLNAHNFPIAYNSCTGSTSHGPYSGFEDVTAGLFGGDIMFQNYRGKPGCLYGQGPPGPGSTFLPPTGNCFGYFADEWMTFQTHVHVGSLRTDKGHVLTFTRTGTAPAGSGFAQVAPNSTSGTGAGGIYDVSWTGGVYTVTLTNAATGGIGYATGNTLTFNGNSFTGGTAPTNNLVLTVTTIQGDEYINSFFEMWGARQGLPSTKIFQYGPTAISAFSGTLEVFSRVWLLVYNTNRGKIYPSTTGIGSFTLNSTTGGAGGPFTAAMVGHSVVVPFYTADSCLVPGTYLIDSYQSATQVTLHTSPSPTCNPTFADFAILPYPESYSWYDDLIISTARIADPVDTPSVVIPPASGSHLKFRRVP